MAVAAALRGPAAGAASPFRCDHRINIRRQQCRSERNRSGEASARASPGRQRRQSACGLPDDSVRECRARFTREGHAVAASSSTDDASVTSPPPHYATYRELNFVGSGPSPTAGAQACVMHPYSNGHMDWC